MSPALSSCTSQPETAPPATSRTPIRGRRAGRRADGVAAPFRRRGGRSAYCPAANANSSAQVVGHRERDRGGVVGQRLDSATVSGGSHAGATPEHRRSVTAVSGHAFTCSNGSPHASQRYSDLQAVALNAAVAGCPASRSAGSAARRRPAAEGQRDRARTARRGGRRGDAGGGELAAAVRGDPVGGPRRARAAVATRDVARSPPRVQAVPTSRLISRIAGQPRVGRGDRHDDRPVRRPRRRAGCRGRRWSASAAPGPGVGGGDVVGRRLAGSLALTTSRPGGRGRRDCSSASM